MIGCLVLLAAMWGTSGAATSAVTVTVTVPSAIALTNNCTANGAWNLGTVLPGAGAVSNNVTNVCSMSFQSSNDSSMIRIAQQDGDQSAMTTPSGTWNWQVSPANFWSDVDVVPGTPTTAFAVGENGDIYETVNSGATWTAQGCGCTTWAAVSAWAGNRAWAGGYSATLKTWNGTTWSNPAAFPTPASGSITTYNDVEATAAATAFVATDNGLYRTTTTGASWTEMTNGGIGMTAGLSYKGITSAGASNLWATTDTGTVFRSTDGGTTWTKPANQPPGGMYPIEIIASDQNHAWLLSNSGIAYTANAGTSAWSWVGQPNIGLRYTEDAATCGLTCLVVAGYDGWISVSNDGTGTNFTRQSVNTGNALRGVDSSGGNTYVVGEGGVNIFSNNLTTWTVTNQGTAGLQGIDGPSNLVGWAVGSYGTIKATTDGGTTWNTQASPVAANFHDISAPTTQVAYAVGEGGVVVKTSNGGANWTQLNAGVATRLMAVSAPDATTVWIAGEGGLIKRSTDGGSTWNDVSSAGTDYYAISAIDTQVAYVGGSGATVKRTANGGSTWTTQTTPSLPYTVTGIAAIDANTAFAGGGWSTMASTTDGGATAWASVPNPNVGGLFAMDSSDSGSMAVGGDFEVALYLGGAWDQDIAWIDTWDVASIDAHTAWGVLDGGGIAKTLPATSVSDYLNLGGGGDTDWSSSAATTNMFGVCLQAVNVATTTVDPAWNVDPGGQCTAVDTDPWKAVPTTATKVAYAAGAGTTGRIDVVWGVRMKNSQPAGTYRAPVVFEALAPNV